MEINLGFLVWGCCFGLVCFLAGFSAGRAKGAIWGHTMRELADENERTSQDFERRLVAKELELKALKERFDFGQL